VRQCAGVQGGLVLLAYDSVVLAEVTIRPPWRRAVERVERGKTHSTRYPEERLFRISGCRSARIRRHNDARTTRVSRVSPGYRHSSTWRSLKNAATVAGMDVFGAAAFMHAVLTRLIL
jgi:hypothetical protein